MRAIILAAGRGSRLQRDVHEPKCLLRFGGMSLLERHLHILRSVGVDEVVLALGYRHDLIESELDRLSWEPRPTIVLNAGFELGSVLTLHAAAASLIAGGDVLVMDADVLYDRRIAQALVRGARPVNRLLIDRNFEAGDEPMKVCVRAGLPVELRKLVSADLTYDVIGESVGFFRLHAAGARRLADLAAGYVESGRSHMPHEEALRDLVLENGETWEVCDITGAPWIEIDFPTDVVRASQDILPGLQVIAGVTS